jgi:hypothetical protein
LDRAKRSRRQKLGNLGIKAKEAIPTLSETLKKDEDDDVRKTVVLALEKIIPNLEEINPILSPYLKDNNKEIQKEIQRILNKPNQSITPFQTDGKTDKLDEAKIDIKLPIYYKKGHGTDAFGWALDYGVMNKKEFAKIKNRKLENLPNKEIMPEFYRSFKEKTGYAPDASTMILFLSRFDPFWKDDLIQISIVQKYTMRIKQLPDTAISKWDSLLKTNKEETIVYMMQFEELFDNEKFHQEHFEKLSGRISEIPEKVINDWNEVLNTEAKSQVILALATTEAFFKSNKFQEIVSQKALEEHRIEFQEREKALKIQQSNNEPKTPVKSTNIGNKTTNDPLVNPQIQKENSLLSKYFSENGKITEDFWLENWLKVQKFEKQFTSSVEYQWLKDLRTIRTDLETLYAECFISSEKTA